MTKRKKKSSKTKKSPAEETYIGVDFGRVNVGLALGKAGFVTPIKVVSAKNQGEVNKEIYRIIIENKVDKIIMGLPLTAEGKETSESLLVRKFTKLLKIYTKKPVEFQNEYLTSQDALDSAIEMGMSQKRRQSVDHLSAALILKAYCNEKGIN